MQPRLLLSLSAALAFTAVFAAGVAQATELNPTPVWQNDTLLGPARAAAELVKAKLSYDAETKKLTFRLNLDKVEMTLGSKSAKINGKAKTLPEAPKTIDGTAYVPLKNLFVGLGCEVKSGGENAWIVCVEKLCIRLEVPPKPE
jgi:iron complex transport system substrate-binding protein